MADLGDEEWEYEYDAQETEDFYVSIDMSELQHGNPARVHYRSIGGRRSFFFHKRMEDLDLVDGPSTGKDSDSRGNDPKNDIDDSTEVQIPVFGDIQISGLHTARPLAIYNDRFMTLRWASAVGTDLYFVRPSTFTGLTYEPLRSLGQTDLLAVSSTKLTATTAIVDIPQIEDAMDVDPPAPQTSIPNQSPAQTVTKSQKSFLSRLNEVKAKRAERAKLAQSSHIPGPTATSQTRVDHHPPTHRT